MREDFSSSPSTFDCTKKKDGRCPDHCSGVNLDSEVRLNL